MVLKNIMLYYTCFNYLTFNKVKVQKHILFFFIIFTLTTYLIFFFWTHMYLFFKLTCFINIINFVQLIILEKWKGIIRRFIQNTVYILYVTPNRNNGVTSKELIFGFLIQNRFTSCQPPVDGDFEFPNFKCELN